MINIPSPRDNEIATVGTFSFAYYNFVSGGEHSMRKCRCRIVVADPSSLSLREGKSINGFATLMVRDTLHTGVNEDWKREIGDEWRTAY